MKRMVILMLCGALCITAEAGATQRKKGGKKTGAKRATEKVATDPKAAGAQCRFKDGDTFSFGKVKAGPDVVHEFPIVNTGNQPLIIQDAKPSCSCMTSEWTTKPILPGGRGVIKIAFHTNKPGPFSKDVLVQTNAALATGEKLPMLHIKGTVVTE